MEATKTRPDLEVTHCVFGDHFAAKAQPVVQELPVHSGTKVILNLATLRHGRVVMPVVSNDAVSTSLVAKR